MILPRLLTAPMAVLMLEAPKGNFRSLFTFGDSYTTTGFNSSSIQPSPSNPMGNPGLGHGTVTDGINWVGFISTTCNSSFVLSYNLAHYGATINNSIVGVDPEDLVYQVTRDFRNHYCPTPGADQIWNGDNSLFALWLGINDIEFSYLEPDAYAMIPRFMESYFRAIHELYDCGARRFLIMNVPPTSRTPKMLLFEQWTRTLHEKVVYEFNWQLAKAVQGWPRLLDLATIEFYDSWTFMTDMLDNPMRYGFDSSTCIGRECVWWDDFHPSSKFHRLLAADVQEKLRQTF